METRPDEHRAVDARTLVADLHNSIVRGYRATYLRVNYVEGEWRLLVRRLGGMVRGDIVASLRYEAAEVVVERRRLWGRRVLARIPLAEVRSAEALAERVAGLGGLRPRGR